MVSQKEQAVYDEVLKRDRLMAYWKAIRHINGPIKSEAEYLAGDPWICVAVLIDQRLWGTCSGEMERDHVHTHTGGTKGKRPETTMETLVILCHHHHQNGWATSHRPEIREYIKEANKKWSRASSRTTGSGSTSR